MSDVLRPSSKVAPDELIGRAPEALVGRNILRDGFPSPLVIARRSAIEHNLDTMAEFCRRSGVVLAPHGKTSMAPELVRRQLASGAWGITVANAVQARTLFDAGVDRIVIANQLINDAGIAWAVEASSRGLELYCFVDSHEGLERLDRSGEHAISVLVEVGRTGGRSGVRSLSEAMALAEAAAAMGSVRLAGLAGYEGVFVNGGDPDDRSETRAYLGDLATAFEAVAEAGHLDGSGPTALSAGGSAAFDDVVELLGPGAERHGAELVLRSGCYVTHDSGFYERASPLRAHSDLAPFRAALEAVAQVISRPEPGLALVDLGKRDVSFDEGLPVPLWWEHQHQRAAAPASWRTTKLMDQHLFLELGADDDLAVGDTVAFGISHPCTTFDKWRHIPEVDDEDNVVAVLATEF